MPRYKQQQSLYLGIDTGGTFTDAVILDAENSTILSRSKALTTRHNLSIGLKQAMRDVIDKLPATCVDNIKMVSISTTLATNALVEGEGSRVCAILIGYEEPMINKSLIQQKLSGARTCSIRGGHDSMAREIASLDERELEEIVRKHLDDVDAFAVSAQFSVRNPSHELRAKEVINKLCNKPVTCGHELASALDAPRRALTTALNASLIPKIRGLIVSVSQCLEELRVNAPLMVVKGDGTVAAVDVIQQRPIETILSGPAASMIGAQFLSGEKNFILSDMGGTTTDIGVLLDGRAKLADNGAIVGGTRTMIQAIDLRTFALGGDSLVEVDRDNYVRLGPRRAIPISLTGRSAEIRKELKRQLQHKDTIPFSGQFALMQREHPKMHNLDARKSEILELLTDRPCPLDHIIISPTYRRHLNDLCRMGLVGLSGFTPTDALHVLGEFSEWSTEAATLGAALLLRWRRGIKKPSSAQIEDGNIMCMHFIQPIAKFGHEVRSTVQVGASRALLDLALQSNDHRCQGIVLDNQQKGEPFRTLVSQGHKRVGLTTVGIRVNTPIVAVGAPVKAYYPEIGRRLSSNLVMPDHFDVANAVGAVTGLIIQSCEVLINRSESGTYRVHLVDRLHELDTWEQALGLAKQSAVEGAQSKAREAGAETSKVEYAIQKIHLPGTRGDEGIVEAIIRAEAIGRPTTAMPTKTKICADPHPGLH